MTFEMTPAGRQPVAGASLWVETGLEVGIATTRSDRLGGFFVCNLPKDTYIWATKSGYDGARQGPIDVSGTVPLEIELKRR